MNSSKKNITHKNLQKNISKPIEQNKQEGYSMVTIIQFINTDVIDIIQKPNECICNSITKYPVNQFQLKNSLR